MKTKSDQKPKVWVLTFEVNDYDQHGEYFVDVFAEKPTIEQIIDSTKGYHPSHDVAELLKFCLHVQNGGGRRSVEDVWYNLVEVDLK